MRGLATAFRLRRIWPLGSPRLKPCGPQLASFRKFGPGRRNIRKAVVCETKPFKKALALSALQRLQSEVPFRWSCDGSSAEPLRISLCRRRRPTSIEVARRIRQNSEATGPGPGDAAFSTRTSGPGGSGQASQDICREWRPWGTISSVTSVFSSVRCGALPFLSGEPS